MQEKVIKALAETVFLFGLLGWLYTIAMQMTRPETIYFPLALWLPLRLDYFGEICFVASIIAFFIMRMKSRKK